jgi:tRNA(Ile)-lysidine synthase
MLDRLTIERMEAAARGGAIVVALSGGGDSAALLHLLKGRFGGERLSALIVDHALREGSANDAQGAQTKAQALGVLAEIVTLAWPLEANRSQQSAREKRYVALCVAARKRGARVIALGHTADDQAETVFMRAAAGSTWRGLAGMAAIASAPVWPEGRQIIVARPLLDARREDLRAFLRQRTIDWIEDPANANPAYERVRVRERLAALAGGGFGPMRLAHQARRLRALADRIDAGAGELIARAARFEADRIVITPALWSGGAEVRRRALSALIAAAAGAQREPGADALARLEERIAEKGFRGATLAGTRLRVDRGALVLERDRGALTGRADGAPALAPLALPGAVETVWDGRLALCAARDGVIVYADAAGVRLSTGEERDLPIEVTSRWLLADRAAHALNVDTAMLTPSSEATRQNVINIPKV